MAFTASAYQSAKRAKGSIIGRGRSITPSGGPAETGDVPAAPHRQKTQPRCRGEAHHAGSLRASAEAAHSDEENAAQECRRRIHLALEDDGSVAGQEVAEDAAAG